MIFEKMAKEDPMTNPKVQLEFKLIFEEIWDFKVVFIDWRTSSLQNINKQKDNVSPKVIIQMKDKQALI